MAIFTSKRRIALFGGTFDPVHDGHVYLAESARMELGLDEVRFIPCQISPHKQGTNPTAAADRYAMLQLATQHLPWAIVDRIEIDRGGTSYSYQTAEAIAEQFPDAQLFWILGTDQWRVLPNWASPERLASRVEFVVFDRGESAAPREGYRMVRLHGAHPASATKIRCALAEGKPAPWLHPEVAAWIRQHQLYC